MVRKRKSTKPQPIGDVLFAVLKRKGMASKIEENILFKLWPKAVGPQIASKTKPDAFKNGILFVKTVSSVWVQQLHFVKQDILDKFNQLSGKQTVKEIRFLVGHGMVGEKAQHNISPSKKTVLKKRDQDMIAACTDSLADQELADVLKRVMHLEISRRRQMENAKAR